MLLAVIAACAGETVEVPGETVVVEKVVTETVEVPGETVTVEVVKEVEVPGETVVVEKEVVKTVEVPGETVVVEKEVVKTVEVPGETVTVEVVKEVQVPGETVVVEKEVVKTVEVPGETVVVEKEVVKTVEVPGETVVVEKVVVQEVPGKNYVTDPTSGKVFTAPEYGGTLTYVLPHSPPLDTYYCCGGPWEIAGVVETLGIADWAVDRDKWTFPPTYLDSEQVKGLLAESWDISPDGLAYTFNIREGVRWHNKAPMNGRELTADDIVYNYHRMLGNRLTGTEFSEAEPSPVLRSCDVIESVTATDESTVAFKLSHIDLNFLVNIGTSYCGYMYPPEVIEESRTSEVPQGIIKNADWSKLVGTGPYEITDSVEGTSMTYTKNPDYWGYDEKYPANRLPYIDQLTNLKIQEAATVAAALRTAKIDMIIYDPGHMNFEFAESISRTNPEITLWKWYSRSNYSLAAYNPLIPSPTDDIMVRHAIQMALDLETITATYFKGHGKWIPQGKVGDGIIGGYNNPFEEWPEEVKQYWRYDPEGAEKLLDEAGYPRGPDGIRFSLPLVHRINSDLGYLEILKAYLAEIGIDGGEIETVDQATWVAMAIDGTWGGGGLVLQGWHAGMDFPPERMCLKPSAFYMKLPDDPVWEAMHEGVMAAATFEEQARLVKACDWHQILQHMYIWGPKVPQFSASQPWVMGYNGENALSTQSEAAAIYARLWIDQELKEAMGH